MVPLITYSIFFIQATAKSDARVQINQERIAENKALMEKELTQVRQDMSEIKSDIKYLVRQSQKRDVTLNP